MLTTISLDSLQQRRAQIADQIATLGDLCSGCKTRQVDMEALRRWFGTECIVSVRPFSPASLVMVRRKQSYDQPSATRQNEVLVVSLPRQAADDPAEKNEGVCINQQRSDPMRG